MTARAGTERADHELRQRVNWIRNASIEVMPRTAAKIRDFRSILPAGTRIYVAHIEKTPFEDMLDTAARLREDGFRVMPHFPARVIPNLAEFGRMVARYAEEAGVTEALALGGSPTTPHGELHSTMQLLESGYFDKAGFSRIHIAGHPEGNRDIDPGGGTRQTDLSLGMKHRFAQRTDAEVTIVTQFLFESRPAARWMSRLESDGIDLPVRLGIAGPTRLQTLIKFAVACGVGPSLRVLRKQARNVANLVRQHEPTDLVHEFAELKAAGKLRQLEGIHIFPLGGILASARWLDSQGTTAKDNNSSGILAGTHG